jgi:Xaa-Pro aminopeptidase
LFFDPFEWNIEEFDFLNKTLKNVSFEKKRYLSKFKRIIKNSKEISFLEQAVKIGRNSIHDFQKKLQSGKTEQELHFQLENNLRHFGKYDLSFNPILAINNNASKPHSLPTNKILKKGDLILIDAGVKYNRYCSDRTETISFKGTFSNKVQKIYDVVQKAHDKAIKKIRSGISADEVDKIARNVIEKAGFGKNFIHSTGHGVGLDIHEFPNISSRSKTKIKNGMVFTIEPAIYIPNFIGIRIENMVVIENEKARIL